MKDLLNYLFDHNKLTKEEAKEVLIDISKSKYNEAQVTSFISIFLMRSITVDELEGFRQALLELAKPVNIDNTELIDLCGTGGDGKNTFNISTLTSFVVAAYGKKVAKHGNYGVSSVCGSSNVLESLGYRFSNDMNILEEQLEKCNITFLHAPLFHPAMKFVGPIRKQMGVKTFFNMLGPIVNPVQPRYQSVGVFSLKLQRLYSHIFQKTDKKYNILYDLGGYDEYSNTGTTKLIRRTGEKLVDPSHFNLKACENKDIFGGNTVQEAASIFTNLLENKSPHKHKEVVSANAAIALSLYDKDASLESLYHEAMEIIESGKAYGTFKQLIRLSQEKT